MKKKLAAIVLLLFSIACKNNADSPFSKVKTLLSVTENPFAKIKDITLPEGFSRIAEDSGSFSFFLRNTALKKSKTVYLFNGKPKNNQTAQFALLDIPTGTRDLQQCADAVMRLRAEYLFARKEFSKIIFFDNANTVYQFSAPYTRVNFDKYLNRVFGMCGSASLSKQLKSVPDFETIQTGDVIIRGGFPGHAVIVMDVAENTSGEKVYLLAQSYMPAQDIHVLKNPENENLSPWYDAENNNIIQTPEYIFTGNELKRW